MRVLRTAAALLLAAAVLFGMLHTMPVCDITSPVAIRGEAGTRVEGRDYAFAAAGIHFARTVRVERFGERRDHTTSGVWILIEGAAAAKTETLALTSTEWLGPSGVRYALPALLHNTRISSVRASPTRAAPARSHGLEVPDAELPSGTLIVSRSAYTPLGEELWIGLGEKHPKKIAAAVTLASSDVGLPWVLKVE